MSFVDLMASDVWTDADISTRVRALIRTSVSEESELKASRLARKENPTADDMAYIAQVDAAVDAALAEGVQARLDMALLLEVLAVEAGELELEKASEQAKDLHAFRKNKKSGEVTANDAGQ